MTAELLELHMAFRGLSDEDEEEDAGKYNLDEGADEGGDKEDESEGDEEL